MKKSYQQIATSEILIRAERRYKNLERFIQENSKSCNMSDTKWRKLFLTLSHSDLDLRSCDFKLVGEEKIIPTRFPQESDLREAMFDDTGFGLFLEEYKYIEWIEIPEKYKDERRGIYIPQDIEKAYQLLQNLGQFEMRLMPTGLRIFGYS